MSEKANRNVKSVAREHVGASRDQRHEAHVANSAKLRKQTVSFKRRPTCESEAESYSTSREQLSALLKECRDCLNAAVAISSADDSLIKLRKVLSKQDDTVIETAIELGVVSLLIKILENSSCPANQVEAVWCITNIATGTSEQTESVLCTAPILVQLLEIENSHLQEQCVWALGNMAGDNADFRNRIRANGAIVPIVRLIQSSVLSLARTSCWALSNLARGLDPRLQELFAAGAGEALALVLVSASPDEELMVEVAWTLTYLTPRQVDFMQYLERIGGVRKLASLLQRDSTQLIIPVLRTLGNIVSGPDELADCVVNCPEVPARLVQLLRGEHKAIKKEAAWTISNICAGLPAHRDAMMAHGAGPALVETLVAAHFDVRKEAAFALYHLASDPRHAPALLRPALVAEAVSLLRAPDPEVQEAAVGLLERSQDGVEGAGDAIEAAGGIDALEALVYSQGVHQALHQRTCERYAGRARGRVCAALPEQVLVAAHELGLLVAGAGAGVGARGHVSLAEHGVRALLVTGQQ